MAVARTAEALEDVAVECTHCGMRMTPHEGSGRRVRYFRCASCHRWVSSSYADVLRADAHVRTRPLHEASGDVGFEQVKARLERWLTALDDQDPYRVLGLSPLASPAEVRERYRELAFRSHPDRGGAEHKMQELNLAYERILHHQERRARAQLPSQTARQRTGLPARSR